MRRLITWHSKQSTRIEKPELEIQTDVYLFEYRFSIRFKSFLSNRCYFGCFPISKARNINFYYFTSFSMSNVNVLLFRIRALLVFKYPESYIVNINQKYHMAHLDACLSPIFPLFFSISDAQIFVYFYQSRHSEIVLSNERWEGVTLVNWSGIATKINNKQIDNRNIKWQRCQTHGFSLYSRFLFI